MFTISTAEIRWFQRGRAPGAIKRWLVQQPGLYEEQPVRTDIYLLVPGMDDLGMKLREGNMEIKKRTGKPEPYSHEPYNGTLETWVKWSIRAEEGMSPGNPMFADPAHWIGIRKERYIQKYAIGEDEVLSPHPTQGYPVKGVAVELSELTIRDQAWWTFGLECFGPPETVLDSLISHFPLLVHGMPEIPFASDDSMGYPEWIDRVVT